VCLILGRSVASGLNEDFDSGPLDTHNVSVHPPVILSVAESDLMWRSDVVPSYAESTLTDSLAGSRNIASEFYTPPSLLTASGYLGSHGSLPEVVTNLADGHVMMRKVGLGQQVVKKSINQAVSRLSDRMKVPRRQDTGRLLGELQDSDGDSASLRSALSDDEDETVSLLYQLEGQLEQPAFEHHVPYSDDVSVAASEVRDEDHDIVGEVCHVTVLHACFSPLDSETLSPFCTRILMLFLHFVVSVLCGVLICLCF